MAHAFDMLDNLGLDFDAEVPEVDTWTFCVLSSCEPSM